MSNNEKELISIIREHDDPQKAVEIAIKLMFDFLEQRAAPQDTSSARPRVSA